MQFCTLVIWAWASLVHSHINNTVLLVKTCQGVKWSNRDLKGGTNNITFVSRTGKNWQHEKNHENGAKVSICPVLLEQIEASLKSRKSIKVEKKRLTEQGANEISSLYRRVSYVQGKRKDSENYYCRCRM